MMFNDYRFRVLVVASLISLSLPSASLKAAAGADHPDCGSYCSGERQCDAQCTYPVGESWAISTCGEYDGGAANGWCAGDSCNYECSLDVSGETVCYSGGDATTCEAFGICAICGDLTCSLAAGEALGNCPGDCDPPVSPSPAQLHLVPNLNPDRFPESFLDACQSLSDPKWEPILPFVATIGGKDGELDLVNSGVLEECFSELASNELGFTMEIAPLGDVSLTDVNDAFDWGSQRWDQYINAGANIVALRIDNPLYNGEVLLSMTESQIVEWLADYVELVRANYDVLLPDLELVLIANYPGNTPAEIDDFVNDLQTELALREVDGIDVLELDFDANGTGSWTDIADIVDNTHNASLDFGGLFWGKGGESNDLDYATDLTAVAKLYADHGIVPDRYTVETWNLYPHYTIHSMDHGHRSVYDFVYAVTKLLEFWPW